MTLKAQAQLAVAGRQEQAQDLGAAVASMQRTYGPVLASGVLAGQGDVWFHDQRTLAASATEDLDLAGVLADPLGGLVTFARIKTLIVSAASANSNNVVVGGAVANGFIGWVGGETHTVVVRPGATVAVLTGQADAVGYPVTAGTGDLLRIGNSGGSTGVTYDIVLIGTSA